MEPYGKATWKVEFVPGDAKPFWLFRLRPYGSLFAGSFPTLEEAERGMREHIEPLRRFYDEFGREIK